MKIKTVIKIFFFLYLLLPEYFALEISESLPLLTFSRMLIIFLFIIMLIKDRKKNLYFNDIGINIYIYLLVLVNIIHLSDAFVDSVKDIFSLLFEQSLLIILIVWLLDDNKKVILALKSLVFASGIIGILGIIESFTGFNIFYLLTTTSREMLQSSYERLNLIRASGPFGHSVYFAVYCVSMLPFTLYFYENTGRKIFFIIASINIISTLFSGSRGQILVLMIMIIYMLFKKKKIVSIKYIKKLIWIIPIFTIISIFIPNILLNITNIIKATLGSIGLGIEVNDFGENLNGVSSRLEQLSGLYWLYYNGGILFGFGSNCHTRGLVRYLTEYGWSIRKTFDVGYIAMIYQYGLIGAIGYFYLLTSKLKIALKKSDKFDIKNLNNVFVFFFISYLLNLITTVGLNALLFTMIGIFSAYNLNIKNYTKSINKQIYIY